MASSRALDIARLRATYPQSSAQYPDDHEFLHAFLGAARKRFPQSSKMHSDDSTFFGALDRAVAQHDSLAGLAKPDTTAHAQSTQAPGGKGMLPTKAELKQAATDLLVKPAVAVWNVLDPSMTAYYLGSGKGDEATPHMDQAAEDAGTVMGLGAAGALGSGMSAVLDAVGAPAAVSRIVGNAVGGAGANVATSEIANLGRPAAERVPVKASIVPGLVLGATLGEAAHAVGTLASPATAASTTLTDAELNALRTGQYSFADNPIVQRGEAYPSPNDQPVTHRWQTEPSSGDLAPMREPKLRPWTEAPQAEYGRARARLDRQPTKLAIPSRGALPKGVRETDPFGQQAPDALSQRLLPESSGIDTRHRPSPNYGPTNETGAVFHADPLEIGRAHV